MGQDGARAMCPIIPKHSISYNEEVIFMITICELCIKTFKPEKINGVRILKTFEGYTVDLRLRQFRKVIIGESLEFIDFENRKGQKLLRKLHEEVIK
jgi:hypothetical protein